MTVKNHNATEERYARQTHFAGIGKEGQSKLAKSRVLIIGCGGLGSVTAELLARAGVGYIKIIDRDFLQLSNLQRQFLFDEQDIRDGLPKAVAAKRKLQHINSTIAIDAHVDDVNRFNIENLIKGIDLVIDSTDNFQTRFLINDACVKNQIPWIFGACAASYGQTMNIIPKRTPCLRCLIEKIPDINSTPTSETVGIIGPIVTTIAAIQCSEALKILTGTLDYSNQKLLIIDLWENNIEYADISKVKHDHQCPVCDFKQFSFLSGKYSSSYISICGSNAVQILPFEKTDVDLKNLAIKLSEFGDPIYSEYFIKYEIDDYELAIFPDGRVIINGTTDTGIARGLYDKCVKI